MAVGGDIRVENVGVRGSCLLWDDIQVSSSHIMMVDAVFLSGGEEEKMDTYRRTI